MKFALALILGGMAVNAALAQTDSAAVEPQSGAVAAKVTANRAAPDPEPSVNPKIPAPNVPEYTNVVYARGTDGSLTALPKAELKIGKIGGMGITLPADIPTVAGPLVVKLEGSRDPKAMLEIGCGAKKFNKELKFEAKDLGSRVFELKLGSAPAPDCVVALKATDGLQAAAGIPEAMFAFRTAGGAK